MGHSEAGLRSLSVVPGVLSVGLVYALAKKLFTRGIALGAAALSEHFVVPDLLFAGGADICLADVLILAAGLALGTHWKRRQASGDSCISLATGCSARLRCTPTSSPSFSSLDSALFVLIRRRKQLVPFIAGSAVAVLLFLPWVVTLLRAAAGNGQNYRRYLFLKMPQAYFSFLFGDTLIPLDGEAVTHIRATLIHFAPLLLGATLSVAVLLPFVWLAWKRWGDRL